MTGLSRRDALRGASAAAVVAGVPTAIASLEPGLPSVPAARLSLTGTWRCRGKMTRMLKRWAARVLSR